MMMICVTVARLVQAALAITSVSLTIVVIMMGAGVIAQLAGAVKMVSA